MADPDRTPASGWRRLASVVLLALSAALWLFVGVRLYFGPPPGGSGAWLWALVGLAAALNAVALGLCAWWLWRRLGWARWASVILLVGNVVAVASPGMALPDWLALIGALAALGFVVSLLVRPEA
ncbi:MAG: hypothetical protein WCF12_13650 [Propionicimonas sp.]